MARSKTLPPPPEWAIREALQLPDVHVSWLAGDGSDRCYYRIRSSASYRTFVLMQLSGDDAKQLQADGYEWVKIGRLLHDHGIYAPQTIAPLPDFAALIIEDYGDIMMETRALALLEAGQRSLAMQLYRKVFPILGRFLHITAAGSSHWKTRSFDAHRLDWELHFFREQFLEGVLQWTLDPTELAAFRRDSAALASSLALASKFFVHRDFHSRNLMVKDEHLAVIDFQDARLGPPTYDLVSLCFDSYIPLQAAERRQLVEEGLTALQQQNPGLDRQALAAEWGPMLLQRQLKALGSFGFLTTKKNRGNYLRYVEPALATLTAEHVSDARWPFLSGDLLHGIHQRWTSRP
jgi:aminoglycoside/choline kinase family phosphotransferase